LRIWIFDETKPSSSACPSGSSHRGGDSHHNEIKYQSTAPLNRRTVPVSARPFVRSWSGTG
jgi:hypothetical protein